MGFKTCFFEGLGLAAAFVEGFAVLAGFAVDFTYRAIDQGEYWR